MKLIYQGKNGEFINEVPARDLEPQDIKDIATKWQLSLAETEGLLLRGKLYKQALKEEKQPAKLHRPSFPTDSQNTPESEQE